ncbi:MAG: CxxC-x17-CxxC domain-containing protein [Candidatus Omnitrophota bacterium]
MKKSFGRKKPLFLPRAKPDVSGMIERMQQQLFSMEKKIDTLISQSQARPSGGKPFSKPFQRFDRPNHNHQDRQRQGDNFRERNFTRVVCSDCRKECEVPFKPSGDRPVYCKECFAKRKNDRPFEARHDNRPREESFSREPQPVKQRSGRKQKSGKRKQPFFSRKKRK